jgi:hypothetical protein
MVDLHELEPLDLPAACRSPAVTISAVQGVGWGVIPARYPLPASSYIIRPFRPRFRLVSRNGV